MARGDPDPQRRRAAGEPRRRFQAGCLAVDPGVDRCWGSCLQPRRGPRPARNARAVAWGVEDDDPELAAIQRRPGAAGQRAVKRAGVVRHEHDGGPPPPGDKPVRTAPPAPPGWLRWLWPAAETPGHPAVRPPGDRFCPIRQGMPARKRPTPDDTMTVRHVLLDGLARDADVFELVSEFAPLHPRDNTFPGGVFLHVAADALDWCRVSRADPLPVEGLRERFLPECAFRSRKTGSSSTPCWPPRPSMAAPNRTCLRRSTGGRPTTSGSTPCSRRSPTSVPPPAGRACRGARHARTWSSALATQLARAGGD